MRGVRQDGMPMTAVRIIFETISESQHREISAEVGRGGGHAINMVSCHQGHEKRNDGRHAACASHGRSERNIRALGLE